MTLKQPLSRLLSLLLLTAATLSALPLSAEEFTIGSLTYTSDDNSTASVSKCDENATGELIIPASVEYDGRTYSVTSIGVYAFDGCRDMTSVEIPNSVTSIGSSAFYGCTGLTSVEIPNSVTIIDWYAFEFCSGLTSVEIPSSVTNIGERAFYGCSSLTTIQVEPGNSNYCSLDGVLFNSDKSELVAFPAGKAGEYQIPNSVTSIGWGAFYGSSSLTSVSIPNSVTSISTYAFNGCSSLTSVEIPNSVTNIGNGAFRDCSSLTSVEIPNSVTSIGAQAFYWCSSLTSVTIPNSVTSIDSSAFSGCSGLASVTIPNSVTSIGYGTFVGCSGLTSVTIPSSVTNIGERAFYGCSSLTSVTIPSSVTSIGEDAFCLCSSLASVTIPSSVTNIGYGAFYGCSSLASVTIPSSVTSIGEYAFYWCENLRSIYLFGKSAEQLPAESVYTFYDNGYSYDNAVYLVGEISTTQTTAEFDVQKVGDVESFDFEYLDANDAVAKETVNQSGLVSLGNLKPGSTTGLRITVHMADGKAYEYSSEITTKEGESSTIEEVKTVEDADGFNVYNLSGECVRRNATDLSGLRPGVYVANGRKFIVR